MRLAVKIADERINELRHSYAGKDDQDFIAMCLLMYATDQVTDANALNPVQQELVHQMIKKVDKALE